MFSHTTLMFEEIYSTIFQKEDSPKFHLRPVVVVRQGPPTGIRLHQLPSRPEFTPSLWLPCPHREDLLDFEAFLRAKEREKSSRNVTTPPQNKTV